MNSQELVEYYADLLIIQYQGKPKARATIKAVASALIQPQTTIQKLAISEAAASGSFVVSWEGDSSAAIAWNASAAAIQTAIRLIDGLSEVTVTGSFASGGTEITIVFDGVLPVAPLVEVASSVLNGSGATLAISVTGIDEVLPLAIQNGFNLIGDNLAVGAQLDIIGKYAGVQRSGIGFSGLITLDDADFHTLIKMGISRNNLGSSLYDIDTFLNNYFPGLILVFDFTNMQMSYSISTAVGSLELIQRIVTERLLPKPMGVQLGTIIYAPTIVGFFGFRTYVAAASQASPFNSYTDYQMDRPLMSYAYGIFIP